jgi:hypothetical protein
MPNVYARTGHAADALVTDAVRALAEYGNPDRHAGNGRPVAVQQLATGAVRAATARLAVDQSGAGFTDADELHGAHLLIAELAARLAEEQGGAR